MGRGHLGVGRRKGRKKHTSKTTRGCAVGEGLGLFFQSQQGKLRAGMWRTIERSGDFRLLD